MKRCIAWIAAGVFAWPAAAVAQTPSASARELTIQHQPVEDQPHPLQLDLGETAPRLPGALRLGALTIDGLFQPGTAGSEAGFGGTWQATAAASFDAPGRVKISAGVIARRGYQLPLFMTTAAGSDVAIASQGRAFATTTRVPTVLDTRVRIERRVFTGRAVRVDVAAEGLNLMDANPSRGPGGVSDTITSRTFRIGIVLGFD